MGIFVGVPCFCLVCLVALVVSIIRGRPPTEEEMARNRAAFEKEYPDPHIRNVIYRTRA